MGVNISKKIDDKSEIFGFICEEDKDIEFGDQLELSKQLLHIFLEKPNNKAKRNIYATEIRSFNDINACSKNLTSISSDLQQFLNINSLIL